MKSILASAVDELIPLVRTTPAGARSLAHVCVVVPTAQSGRRLRKALAARLGALVPPLVKTSMSLILDEESPALAGRTEEIRALLSVLPTIDPKDSEALDAQLEHARQLSDLRTLLLPKKLSFADVAAVLAVDMPDEAARWEELAELERRYLKVLAERGLKDRVEMAKAYRAEFPGVETILRFDEFPAVDLADGCSLAFDQITPCATPADEAERIAAYFAEVRDDEALPALCVADPELFPEIETAFKVHGLKIHNPASTPLVNSSLGHLVNQIVALVRTQSYTVFSAFVRGGDVRRWLVRELRLTEEELTAALIDLDRSAAEFLPEKIDDIAPKTGGTLRAVFEFVKVQLRKKSLRAILGAIFRDFILDEHENSAREFAAAAEALNGLIEECLEPKSTAESATPTPVDYALFVLRLVETGYSLEPDEGEVVLTDGWMELPFVEADELVIAGFCEGCVPESTVGHPYLPDSLRHRLGLPDNRFKETRDRAILSLAVGTRAHDAVHVLFHAITAKGDVLKPSRLLFETANDVDLAHRVKAFYGVKAGTAEPSASDLPASWKLALPIPAESRELTKISPTRLDGYLRCPFTFYLRDKGILGDKRMKNRAEELESWEFGNLAHAALEAFGVSALVDSIDAEAIEALLSEQVDEQLVARFGTSIPAIVAMQGESVKRRLANFAVIQAAHRKEGWKIVAVERKLEIQYGHTRLYGKTDRIDRNERTGEWRVIDYKTWDRADKTADSVQLPLYCAMLDACGEESFADAHLDSISSAYCVLGRSADHVRFTEPTRGALVPEAETLVRGLITRIERGIFWPPASTNEWRYDYEDWLAPNPETSVDETWIADQLRRIALAEKEAAT